MADEQGAVQAQASLSITAAAQPQLLQLCHTVQQHDKEVMTKVVFCSQKRMPQERIQALVTRAFHKPREILETHGSLTVANHGCGVELS